MDSLGLSNALEQQEGLTQNTVQMNNFINEQNSVALQDYHQQLANLKSTDTHENEVALTKIGAYGIDGTSKINEYRNAVKSGKTEGGLLKSKTAQRLGKLYKGDLSDLSKDKSITLKGVETSQTSIGDATEGEKAGKLLIKPEGIDIGKKIGRSNIEDYVKAPTEPTKILGRSGEGESFMETSMREGTGEILKTPEMKGASTLEKIGSGIEGTIEGTSSLMKGGVKAGRLISGVGEAVGKTAGGLMSVAMLGDDIYNQVSNKEFFTGDNAGEKVGNFANEVGSVMDLAGAVSGDPFLVMAGVGVGAMGSAVSEISSLFEHKKVEDTAQLSKEKGGFKPKPTPEIASQNIIGEGKIAETSKSTLEQVS